MTTPEPDSDVPTEVLGRDLDRTRERFDTLWGRTTLAATAAAVDCDETIRPDVEGTLRRSAGRQHVLPGLETEGDASELAFAGTLGEGGMGLVRLARQVPLGRDVAVKTLKAGQRNAALERALLEEAWVTGRVEHPNIAPVYTLGRSESDGAPLIVMKRIEGVPWRDLLEARDLEFHLHVLEQVCNALSCAHARGIVHRDIKPENVMIGEFEEVYLLDWGIAVSVENDPSEMLPQAADQNEIAGTPSYMAPEMTVGDGGLISPQTDVYQLGAVLHELVTGQVRHRGTSLYEVMFSAYQSLPFEYDARVPDELAAICNRSMAAEPEDRHPSAEAFRDALRDYARHRSSNELTQEANERLADLEAAVEAEPLDDALAQRVRELSGQCQFGFLQARRVWSENARAAVGRDDTYAAMARWELRHDDVSAARAWLSQMERDDDALERGIAAAEDRLQSAEREVEALRRISREEVLSIGSGARAAIGLSLAVVWGVIPLLYRFMLDRGLSSGSELERILTSLLIPTFALLLAWGGRRVWTTPANRRVLYLFVAVGATVPLYRTACALADVDFATAMGLELTLFGLTTLAMAIMTTPWLVVSAAAFFAGSFAALAFPAYALELIAAADFVAGVSAAIVWTRLDD